MRTLTKTYTNNIAIERLTALWALNECGLGGFMHAFSSPFTGILVGGISVLFVSLIALHSKNVWPTILKSLSLVLLVKLTVSPHSPIPAYFAVSFQAVLGALLYSIFSVKPFSIVLLSLVTFLESALQKLLTLTIVYGQSLWDALDTYGEWVVTELTFLPFNISSTTFIYLYIGTYGFAGLCIGLFIINIIKRIKTYNLKSDFENVVSGLDRIQPENKPKSKLKRVLLVWFLTLIIILIPVYLTGMDNHGIQKGFYIFLRSIAIILLWYIVVGPFILKLIKRYLLKKKGVFQQDLADTLISFPYLRQLIRLAWLESKDLRGYHKLLHFIANSIVYCINFKIPKS